ncbi:MAG TPA: tryptophan--tRNA ligase [Nitriliruptorales bacterium]
MTRVLSGIQPSGTPHLGNYIGAFKRWAQQQHEVDGYYCIVDLHAVTVRYDPAILRERTIEMACSLFAAGLDPEVASVFVQSHVPEHAELAWLLNCIATMGELNRMVQWKVKSTGQGESVSVGLFDYPVLQAADILIYQADEVPVGDDQRQHVELTRDIAQRFNHRYGQTFTVPKATTPKAGARVMDLQEPGNKMSKSTEADKGVVYMLDPPGRIEKKIKAAVTDSGSEVRYDPDGKQGVSNLLDLLSAVTGREIADLEDEFAGSRYGDFKQVVAQAVVEFVAPFQQRYEELAKDPAEIERLLGAGADKAQAVAATTLAQAKQAMGFLEDAR